MKVSEDVLLDAFRWTRMLPADYLGVKMPWWAKLVVLEYNDGKIVTWEPSPIEISYYEKLLFGAFLRLDEWDRKLIISRCGSGRKKSYRKCSRIIGIHHEVYRKQIQRVINELQNYLDEMELFGI